MVGPGASRPTTQWANRAVMGGETEILMEWPVATGQGRAGCKAMLTARRGLGKEAIACGQEVRS